MAAKGAFSSAALELQRFLEIIPDGEIAHRVRAKLDEWQEEGLIETAD